MRLKIIEESRYEHTFLTEIAFSKVTRIKINCRISNSQENVAENLNILSFKNDILDTIDFNRVKQEFESKNSK